MKIGEFVRVPERDAVLCYVRRIKADRYRRIPRHGQHVFWFDRTRGLVTERKGKAFCGIAISPLKAGHYGFIQVYGPSI